MNNNSIILKIVISLIVLSLSNNIYSQNRDSSSNKKLTDNLFTGGGLGLQFGYRTIIDISPIIGYRINEKAAIGTGIIYQYLKYKDFDIKSNTYGAKIFARHLIINNVFAHVEYEYLNLDYLYFDLNGNYLYKRRVDVGSLFVGGGLLYPIGGNSKFLLMVLYNLNETEMSPYDSNPIIRAGINIGFN